MSKYNYLIRAMQNKSFSRTLMLQTNLMQVVEESSGIILDSTIDLEFLNQMLTRNKTFGVDNESQILLTSQQLQKYVAERLYYYNPKLLQSRYFSFTTITYDFDPGSLLGYDRNIDGEGTDQFSLYSSELTYQTRLTNAAVGNYLTPITTIVNNVLFPAYQPSGTDCVYTIYNINGVPPSSFIEGFTLFGTIIVDTTSQSGILFCNSENTYGSYYELRVACLSGKLRFYVDLDDADGHSESHYWEFDYTYGEPLIYCLRDDGTNLDLWVNNVKQSTKTKGSFTARTLANKGFAGKASSSGAFLGKILHQILYVDIESDENVAVINGLEQTKFYFTIEE